MWLSTVEIGVANRNPIRYGCRAGAKTIRDSWTQLNGSLLLSTCQLIKHLQLSYHPNLFLRCEILILLFRECYAIVGSCFSASLATKLANKLKEKVLSKTASVWRSCEDLPCSVISSLVLLPRDFTIIAQKESLLAGKRWLDLLGGVEFVNVLSVTTIDCFVLQCKMFW